MPRGKSRAKQVQPPPTQVQDLSGAEDIARRIARNRLAHQRFRTFARMFWRHYVPAPPVPVWSWYHDAICDEVQALCEEADRRRAAIDQVIRLGLKGEEAQAEIARLITGSVEGIPERLILVVEIGPRSSKSSLIQRAFPAWRWSHRPEEQFLTLACSDRLVERDGLYLRDMVQGPPGKEGAVPYQVYLADNGRALQLRIDQNAKSKFDTTAGGTRQGYSIESRFTGADSDVTIIDDPHDLEDLMNRPADSIIRAADEVVGTYRDKVQDRANNLLTHITICTMQRVAENDLAAYMLQKGARSVCLPTLFEPDHPRRYKGDRRTKRGESLDPIRKPESMMEAKRLESPWWFEAKEQQNPSSRVGGVLTREHFQVRYQGTPEDAALTCDEIWISSDSASKGGDGNDFHAIHVYGLKGALRLVLDYATAKMGPQVYDRTMDGMCHKWGAVAVRARIPCSALVEDTTNGAHWLQTRQATMRHVRLYPFLPSLTPGKDNSKAARWGYFVRDATAGRYLLPERAEWVETLLGWWLAGLRATHDDDCDAASQLAVWLEVSATANQAAPSDIFAWLDT